MKKAYMKPSLEAYNVKNETLLSGSLETHNEIGASETYSKEGINFIDDEEDY